MSAFFWQAFWLLKGFSCDIFKAVMDSYKQVFLSLVKEDYAGRKSQIDKALAGFNSTDWEELSGLAIKTRLFPALYANLTGLGLNNIPEPFISRLKKLYVLNLKQNLILQKELFSVLACLEDANISAMPLKGLALGKFLYGDIALRRASCDLDILVKPQQFSEAQEVLGRFGYTFIRSEYKSDFLQPLSLHNKITQVSLCKDTGAKRGILLDLHFSIRGFFTEKDISGLWQEAQKFNFDGRDIYLLSDEGLLIYLSLISLNPLEFLQIQYLYDLQRLIALKKNCLFGGGLLEKLKRMRLCRAVYFPLKISKDLFSADIPEGFLNEIKPPVLLVSLLAPWIAGENVRKNLGRKPWFIFLFNFLLRRYLYSRGWLDFFRKCAWRGQWLFFLKWGQLLFFIPESDR